MSMTGSHDAAAIDRMAHLAVRRLPPEFREHLTDVVVRVQEFADSEALHAVGLDDPWRLMGLYHGHPWGTQSIWSSGDMPSVITLFRRPLLRKWELDGGRLEDIVTHVVVHEVGHHFGLSDADMRAIESEDS